MQALRERIVRFVKGTEGYFKTDMTYLVRAGFWSNMNAAAIAGFSLLLYIAYAHFLSKETYGTYQYLLSFFSIATSFTLTGMNSAAVRSIAKGYEGTLRASIAVQLKYGLIPFAGCLAIASYYWFNGNILIAESLVVIGSASPLLYAYNTYGAYLLAKKDFQRSTLYGIAANAVYYAALIIAAIVSGSPLALLATNLVVQVVLYYFLYRRVVKLYKPNDSVDHEGLRYGMHLSAMGVFGSVAGQLGSIFVFHFLGPASLAIYSFATAVPERLGAICFKFLSGATLAKFSERTAEEIRFRLMHKIFLVCAAGAALAAVYIPLAPIFFHVFFPAYNVAIPYSMVLASGLIFSGAIYLPMAALTALKHTRALYLFNIVNPLVQIIFPLVGIYFGGLWGYLVAHLCLVIFALVFSTILVYKSNG